MAAAPDKPCLLQYENFKEKLPRYAILDFPTHKIVSIRSSVLAATFRDFYVAIVSGKEAVKQQ